MKPLTLSKHFLKRMKASLGADFEDFIKAHDHSPTVSLRINPSKAPNLFSSLEQVPWCKYGRYVKDRPDFVFDPLIHAGAYYVQEASSMLFANTIDFSKELKILDLCGAPGGKSTLVASMMHHDSLLISNELVSRRAKVLQENLIKWGSTNVIVTNSRSADFGVFQNYFDVVLVDAPCSGEGMFRKNKNAIREWKVNKPFKCSIDQKNILDDAIHLLNHNGLLLYSTCTYSLEENEQIISWFYTKYSKFLLPVTMPIKPEWNIIEQELLHYNGTKQTLYKCFPHKLKGEGLFLAGFIYHSVNCKNVRHPEQSLLKDISSNERQVANKFLDNSKELILKQSEEKIYAIPVNHIPAFNLCLERLKTLKTGIFIGAFNRKNNEFIPSHELVMSSILKKDLPYIELNKNQALQYLKKANINLSIEQIPKGWVVVKYKNIPLGWIKNTVDRLNNFYPKEWKIRKELTVDLN